MKNKEEMIREIIYSDLNIVKLIEESPQTYNSMLSDLKDNGTMQCVLRRRMSRLLKQNSVWKLKVPGTRHGLSLFCTPEHDYKMLVYNQIVGKTRIFYMYDYKIDGTDFILEQYWELKGKNWNKWVYCEDKMVIPKYGNRSDVVRLWE